MSREQHRWPSDAVTRARRTTSLGHRCVRRAGLTTSMARGCCSRSIGGTSMLLVPAWGTASVGHGCLSFEVRRVPEGLAGAAGALWCRFTDVKCPRCPGPRGRRHGPARTMVRSRPEPTPKERRPWPMGVALREERVIVGRPQARRWHDVGVPAGAAGPTMARRGAYSACSGTTWGLQPRPKIDSSRADPRPPKGAAPVGHRCARAGHCGCFVRVFCPGGAGRARPGRARVVTSA
jgi:hypothetical protein